MIKQFTLLAALSLTLGMLPAAASERPVVVELFTSEGCSSCPPADGLLAELAARPQVLALSMHVDYWDRLGWKDPFSSPAAAERQHRYTELLGLTTIYTPQIVVDGKWQAVGSNRTEVERQLALAQGNPEAVPVTLALDHGRARITLGPNGESVSAAVLLIGFDRRHVTAVARGENSGRTLVHVDVVRSLDEVAQFDGRDGMIDVPIDGTPIASRRWCRRATAGFSASRWPTPIAAERTGRRLAGERLVDRRRAWHCQRSVTAGAPPMNVERLDHLVLTVADIARTCEFYTRVLGMEAVRFGEGRTALRFGQQKINLHLADEIPGLVADKPTPGSGDLCFITAVPLAEVTAHLTACGIPIVAGPGPRVGAVGTIQSVYIRDPDHNLVEISNY